MATGLPYGDMQKALTAIQYAREHKIPCLGTCQGFLHMMLEYAQNVLCLENPGHQEYDEEFENPFIKALPCSLRGRKMKVEIHEDSQVSRIYGGVMAAEKYYCSFGINPAFKQQIYNNIIRIAGVDEEGDIRIVEYPQHPFMVGTLFVPQARSSKENPHPLITAFLRSII